MATKKQDKEREKRKRAAVISAVIAYMQAEEAAMMQAREAAEAEPAPRPVPPPSMWGMSGRQDAMHLRNLMQLKAFHGGRIR